MPCLSWIRTTYLKDYERCLHLAGVTDSRYTQKSGLYYLVYQAVASGNCDQWATLAKKLFLRIPELQNFVHIDLTNKLSLEEHEGAVKKAKETGEAYVVESEKEWVSILDQLDMGSPGLEALLRRSLYEMLMPDAAPSPRHVFRKERQIAVCPAPGPQAVAHLPPGLFTPPESGNPDCPPGLENVAQPSHGVYNPVKPPPGFENAVAKPYPVHNEDYSP